MSGLALLRGSKLVVGGNGGTLSVMVALLAVDGEIRAQLQVQLGIEKGLALFAHGPNVPDSDTSPVYRSEC